MFICNECGRVTQESDAEFCHYCGSDKGTDVEPAMMPQGYEPISANGGGVIYADKSKLRRIPIALMLAFIPGLFDIFGLGHLVIGRWVKAIAFLALSGGFYYLRFMSGWDMLIPYLSVISIAIFVVQMVDLYNGFKRMLNDSVL